MASKRYRVTVRTANIRKANTNSEVSIILKGSSGETSKRELDTPNFNDFEQGQEDSFEFNDTDVGTVNGCTLFLKRDDEHDNKGPAWFPEWVKVSQKLGDDQYHLMATFNFNVWLGEKFDTNPENWEDFATRTV